MNSQISIVKCASYNQAQVFSAVKKAVDLIGGIEAFIRPRGKVLIKPNLLMASAPESGIVTHPEVVRAVIRLLKEIGCEIVVGDGPSVWGGQIENVDQVYEVSGIKRVCEEEGVSLVKFNRRLWRGKFPLSAMLNECEFLVNVPKFKTHGLTTLTGAVKNLFGLVSGTYKTELHKNFFSREEFAKIIVDIYEATKPALTIVDAITAMEGEGPATSGKLREQNLILSGADCVVLDSVLAIIMGLEPDDILTNTVAFSRGLGIKDKFKIPIAGERIEDVRGKPFLLPTASIAQSKLSGPIAKILQKLVKYYPCVLKDKCIRCQHCIGICPGKAISMGDKGIIFDYHKCIACFCCQEICPASAIKIRKSLLAKMIGL